MSSFDEAIGVLLSDEGDKFITDDNGRGACKYGITLKTYREYHKGATAADIRALTVETATDFYRNWWAQFQLGRIEDQTLATKMLGLTVHIGPQTAIKLLQRAVEVKDDGLLGPRSGAAVNAKPPCYVLGEVRRQGERHYRGIVAAHPERAGQLKGWLARLNR